MTTHPHSAKHPHPTLPDAPIPGSKRYAFHVSNPLAEQKIKWAVLLTVLMMVAEITGGYGFNSMALLADGWHMSTHAIALGLSMLAYVLARRLTGDGRFAFGTWKIEILASFTSAIILVLIAVWMLFQSSARLLTPITIHYNEAIVIAGIGLAVNLVCAWLLKDDHHHSHGHHHGSHHDHEHFHRHDHTSHDDHATLGKTSTANHDLNLRSAYIHVIADAATSVCAMLALIAGKYWGASWLDPLMGIVGSALVAIWSYGLIRDSARILLDAEMDAPVVAEVIEVIAASPIKAQINDIHVWRVGKDQYACVLNLSCADSQGNADYFRGLLSVHDELVHIIIEINVPLINSRQRPDTSPEGAGA